MHAFLNFAVKMLICEMRLSSNYTYLTQSECTLLWAQHIPYDFTSSAPIQTQAIEFKTSIDYFPSDLVYIYYYEIDMGFYIVGN